MTERERQWAAYQAWKKDSTGPIYFRNWDQWIGEFGWAVWQASRRAALKEAAAVVSDHERKGREWIAGSLWDTLANECAARIRALVTGGTNG